MLGGQITAHFACVNENDFCSNLPLLVDRCTRFDERTFPVKGNCAYCTHPQADYVCGICFSPYSATFYCNLDHQTRDWAHHKFDCKPLPKLIRPEQAEAAIALANDLKIKKKYFVPFVEQIKKGDSVVIVEVVNERVLYVRPTREDFNQLITSIKDSSLKASKLSAKPEINDTVLAPHEGELCRAQILDAFETDKDGNDLRCFLLDYGIFKKFKWTNGLMKLGYKFRTLPRHTFKVILDGIKIEKNKNEARNYLEAIKNRKQECEVVSSEMMNEQKVVTLKIKEENINDRIQKFDDIADKDEAILFEVNNSHFFTLFSVISRTFFKPRIYNSFSVFNSGL